MSARGLDRKVANGDYTVGWISAITTEHIAARTFLDEEYGVPESISPRDENNYMLGRIGRHNVVIAVLPSGEYGISSAARVARDMLHTFPSVRIGLLVGIGGGAPSVKHDIRLGDVVVSIPRNGHSGVFQYDFGKTIQEQSFQPTGFLNQPPVILRTAVGGLEAEYEMNGHYFQEAIGKILNSRPRLKAKYARPDSNTDRLYQSHIIHPSSTGDKISCQIACGDEPLDLVPRHQRSINEDGTAIHYGLIASSNQLLKDAFMRDKLGAEKDVLCFEMEAAGLMNHFPCLVIRGICDYADTHKNDQWQGYAAMVAAAYARDLLYQIPTNKVEALDKMAILSDISEGITDLLGKQLSENRNEILGWLTPMDYSIQQSKYISRRQDKTGHWLLDSVPYPDWLNTAGKSLYCQGIPGAGKTILISIVIDHLITVFDKNVDTGTAYVYCDFLQKDEKVDDLLLSLLKQLIRPNLPIPDCVKDLYEHYKEKRTRPSLEQISETLQSVLADYSRSFIIVDALDECQNFDGSRMRFIEEILVLRGKCAANVFVTSRSIPEIASKFREAAVLEIYAKREDVGEYLKAHMYKLQSFVHYDSKLKEETEIAIIESVQGMFLRAQLHLELLQNKFTVKEFRKALASLPTGSNAYDYAYEDVMKRINSQSPEQKHLASRVLSWIIYAKRPLLTTELQHALAVEYGHPELDNLNFTKIEYMLLVCAGLITIDKENHIVRLVHYTAQEYFERTHYKWFPNAEKDVTKTCATYLSFTVFERGFCPTSLEFESRLSSNQLYHYVANYWGYHARHATPLPQVVITFLQSDAKVEASSQALIAIKPSWEDHGYSQDVPRNITGLHLAAYFGVEDAIDPLLRVYRADLKDEFGRTPLSYAASNGHEIVVERLLAASSVDGQTLLIWASKRGHNPVVKLLLVTSSLHVNDKDRFLQAPLLLAFKYGHETVVKQLFAECNSIDINTKDGNSQTPLWWAARNGYLSIVKLLLSKENVDINVKNSHDQTPLWWSASNQDHAMIRLLLEKDKIDVNIKDKDYQTPLGRAARKGFETVVKQLLAVESVDINAADNYGHTALLQAAHNGHTAIVKLLLNKTDININIMDRSCQTPLLWAAKNGHTDVVGLLLEAKRIDVNAKDDNGQTPLLHAVTHGHEAIVKELLIMTDIDVNAKDFYHQTPLLCAAERQ